ncbi:hypothetical protein HYALB_00013348 [Hymenoscyphus albidus]|uniref:Uncharacterized protein n=1 Tax=Hymenoscyphus albidus TaxID=595503 RepID=A0A9N9LUM0_9HELO|nr:hypothetical protein HYALB_00013348 [Hymenoscyphus albidus]
MTSSFEPNNDRDFPVSDSDHSLPEEPEDENPYGLVKSRTGCIESGQRLLCALSRRLSELKNNPNNVRDAAISRAFLQLGGYSGYTSTRSKFRDEENPLTGGSAGFECIMTAFEDLNLDKDMLFSRATVYANSDESSTSADEMNETKKSLVGMSYFSQSGSDGVIIVVFNNMRENNIASSNAKIEHWSELLYQVMKNVYSDNVPDIRYMLMDSISNRSTKQRINEAHLHHPDKVFNWKGTFNPESPDPKEVETCQSIVGSPKGVSIPHLLMDYPASFGQKKIERIHTWSKDWRTALAYLKDRAVIEVELDGGMEVVLFAGLYQELFGSITEVDTPVIYLLYERAKNQVWLRSQHNAMKIVHPGSIRVSEKKSGEVKTSASGKEHNTQETCNQTRSRAHATMKEFSNIKRSRHDEPKRVADFPLSAVTGLEDICVQILVNARALFSKTRANHHHLYPGFQYEVDEVVTSVTVEYLCGVSTRDPLQYSEGGFAPGPNYGMEFELKKANNSEKTEFRDLMQTQ